MTGLPLRLAAADGAALLDVFGLNHPEVWVGVQIIFSEMRDLEVQKAKAKSRSKSRG